jgi:hypothetical protein
LDVTLSSGAVKSTPEKAILDGGNSTASTVNIGTNDNQDLRIETNSNPRVTIKSDGAIGIGTSSPNSGMHVNTSFALAVITIYSDYSITSLNNVILCNASGSDIEVTLPVATGIPGRKYIIKRIGSGTNDVIVRAASGIKIDEADEVTLNAHSSGNAIGFIEVISDGTQWYIIGGSSYVLSN